MNTIVALQRLELYCIFLKHLQIKVGKKIGLTDQKIRTSE